MDFLAISYWLIAIFYIWKLDNAIHESWSFGLRLIAILIIFLLPAFQYWCSYYRKLYLSKEVTFFERYATSFLAPAAPVGYNFKVLFDGTSITVIYLILVCLGAASFSKRANIFANLLPLDKKSDDLFLFNRFPPRTEGDLMKLKLMGFAFLLFPLVVGGIHSL